MVEGGGAGASPATAAAIKKKRRERRRKRAQLSTKPQDFQVSHQCWGIELAEANEEWDLCGTRLWI